MVIFITDVHCLLILLALLTLLLLSLGLVDFLVHGIKDLFQRFRFFGLLVFRTVLVKDVIKVAFEFDWWFVVEEVKVFLFFPFLGG